MPRAVTFAGLAALAAVVLAAGTAAGDPGSEKARVDSRIDDLRGTVAEADRRADVLTEELSAAAGRVRELQAGVDAQAARLSVLERDLRDARARLGDLDRAIVHQTARLEQLRRDYGVALARLERRVRELYMTDDPDLLSFIVGTTSFVDLVDNLELLSRIGREDERLASEVASARDGVADARRRTVAARREARDVERRIVSRAAEQQAVVTRLVASRDALVGAQRDKRATLASIRSDREDVLREVEALEAQSAELAARIRAAQQSSPAAPAIVPPAGSGLLAWPVSGPVTSGFGWRWGRMHEGIDIAVGMGTAVRASAAGTVIHAGWLGGYGNLVVVDHGNGLSTAYAHNSSFAAAVGQAVAAGEVVAYSGSTGNSSGPHVHFEVRVGGSAVDPLGYL